MADPVFRLAVKARWNEVSDNQLSVENINSLIDDYVADLVNAGAVQRNFSRWDVFTGSPSESEIIEDYKREIVKLKRWIELRREWMDEQIQAF